MFFVFTIFITLLCKCHFIKLKNREGCNAMQKGCKELISNLEKNVKVQKRNHKKQKSPLIVKCQRKLNWCSFVKGCKSNSEYYWGKCVMYADTSCVKALQDKYHNYASRLPDCQDICYCWWSYVPPCVCLCAYIRHGEEDGWIFGIGSLQKT